MEIDPQAQIAELRRELELVRERESLLQHIDAATRAATDPTEITYSAASFLGRYLHVNRCVYAEVESDQDRLTVVGDFVDGLASMVGSFTLHQFSNSAHDLMIAGQPFVVEDAETDPRCAKGIEAFRSASINAAISYPLMKDGRLRAIVAVHSKQARHWQAQEISLVASVAARCWESIERSRVLRALEADREELRQKSEQSERRLAELKTIYDTAPIGLAYFDLDNYRYRRLNDRQAAFFGLTPSEIVGKTLTEMAPIQGLRELFDQVARGEPVVNYPLEGTLVTDPSEYRYWTVSYFPVYGPDGAIQGITAASQEITQQKKAEKALIDAEKLAAVGRLASSIAHEINNPLESVTNVLYLMRTVSNPREFTEYLDIADRELRRVAAITNQTLRFHKQATFPTNVVPSALIESVLALYQGRLLNASIKVERRDRVAAPVKCFEGEIRQVLSNFIGNAIDAMKKGGGHLHVRSRTGTDPDSGRAGVFITVADTGTGMDREVAAQLFKPFFTTKGFNGTGLGLWISKGIVEKHRGKLSWKTSQRKGARGTVFRFFLPA